MAVVNISSEGGSHGFPRVIPDNREVGRRAAEHLASLGLRDFAYVGRAAAQYNVPSWISGPRRYARERWEGFAETLAERGITARAFFLPPHPLWKATAWKIIQRELAEFLRHLPKPCGVFAADDPLAVAVRHAGAACGRRVPDDLPLLGEQLAGAVPAATEECVPVGVIVGRESTEFLAFDDREVARLVRWIRLNALGDPIQVSDVLAQSDLSMTLLKARFQTALGHGPKREIMDTRLRHLEYLLRTSDLPLEKIAASMRFPSIESMSRFLFRQTGRRADQLRQ